MWDVFSSTIPTALGMRFEYIIVLILTIAGLMFYAKDFKLGALLSFFVNALTFIWFYQQDLDYVFPLVLFFLNLIILSFSLMAVNKKAEGLV